MQIDLRNKKALVGASTRGIGLAIAKQLAEVGAEITLLARDTVKLEKAKAELTSRFGQQHQYLEVNFQDYANFTLTIDKHFEKNDYDILILNTPGPPAGGIDKQGNEHYSQAFDLIFQTATYLSTKALVSMKNKKWGRIIFVSSITVVEPLPHLILSNSVRAALINWAKTLASDVAHCGITVNSILSGYFDTERLNEVIKTQAELKGIECDSLKHEIQNIIPAKRFGKPIEYGYLATFLSSDWASYITGTAIPIDGGLTKSW